MLQFGGDSQDAVDEQAHALLRALGRSEKEADGGLLRRPGT